MENKLYVGNLSFDATEEAVRTRFAACGPVTDVQLTSDRWNGDRCASALVSMETEAGAEAAIAKLHGADLGGRKLHVKPATRGRGQSNARGREGVKIAQQFRDRQAMVYDLDCAGSPLTLRISQSDDDRWHLEARVGESYTIEAAAVTRRDALTDIARQWRETGPSTLDWEAIAEAMTTVRAV